MHIYATSWHWYLFIIPALPIIIGADLQTYHAITLLFWATLLTVGISSEIYFNMAICFLLGTILLIMNLTKAYAVILTMHNSSLIQMGCLMLKSDILYWMIIEGVLIVIGTKLSFEKYKQFRVLMKNY